MIEFTFLLIQNSMDLNTEEMKIRTGNVDNMSIDYAVQLSNRNEISI